MADKDAELNIANKASPRQRRDNCKRERKKIRELRKRLKQLGENSTKLTDALDSYRPFLKKRADPNNEENINKPMALWAENAALLKSTDMYTEYNSKTISDSSSEDAGNGRPECKAKRRKIRELRKRLEVLGADDEKIRKALDAYNPFLKTRGDLDGEENKRKLKALGKSTTTSSVLSVWTWYTTAFRFPNPLTKALVSR